MSVCGGVFLSGFVLSCKPSGELQCIFVVHGAQRWLSTTERSSHQNGCVGTAAFFEKILGDGEKQLNKIMCSVTQLIYILMQASYLFLATNSLPGCQLPDHRDHMRHTRLAYAHKGGVNQLLPQNIWRYSPLQGLISRDSQNSFIPFLPTYTDGESIS